MTEEELKRYWISDLKWGWGPQSRKIFEFLMEAREFASGGTVLDAGAGHQRYRHFFSNSLYLTQEHPAGIEFKKMQDLSYDLISPLDVRIPLNQDSIDAVISTSVMEHLRYPERFISEAIRVLVPGGRIYINVPFAYPEHEVPYDFQRPTRFGLIRWLEDAGFEQINVGPSSSSTQTAIAFLETSIAQDLARNGQLKRGNLLSGALAWARREPLGFIRCASLWVVVWPLIRALEWIAGSFVDRGPDIATTFPVGWLATAVKPGAVRPRRIFESKEKFLRESC